MTMPKCENRRQEGFPDSIGCTLEYATSCYRDGSRCLKCGWNTSEMARRAAMRRELAMQGVYQMQVQKP